jgi:hypothetical protein
MYVIEALGIDMMDSFYIYRSSNCRFFDEALDMRTSFGEALYFNPVDIGSSLIYIHNAMRRIREEKSTNAIFRRYVLPELSSIWFFSNRDLKRFAKSKGGYFFVPIISLAEVAGFITRSFAADDDRLRAFIGRSLGRKTLHDVRNDWGFRAFDLNPEKTEKAKLHLQIIKDILARNGYNDLAGRIEKPGCLREVLECLTTYRRILQKKSRKPAQFLKSLRNRFHGENIDFTEIVIMNPGLKSKRFQIAHTPAARLLMIQGSMDSPEWPGTNQIVYAHQFASRILPPETRILTVLDRTGRPLADPGVCEEDSSNNWKERALREGILLRFIAAMLLGGDSPKTLSRLRKTWIELIEK